jgi:cytochrome c oxidase subunit 3
MWMFLVQEILFFGGVFTAYLVYRMQNATAFAHASHDLDIRLGLINTAALIASSFTMVMAVHASALARRKATIGWLVATIVLGSVFLGIKVVEYREKFAHHLVPGAGFVWPGGAGEAPGAEMFFSLYFVMTGLHALHMIIGVGLLAWLVWLAWKGRFDGGYNVPVDMVGLYWHFVDIVWIFLFPLLYLIGRHG